MAYIQLISVSSNAISCYIAGLDASYSRSDRYVDWYANGLYKTRTALSAGVSSGSTANMGGFNPNTQYSLSATIFYTTDAAGTNWANASLSPLSATTTALPRPPPFSWLYGKYPGGNFNLTAQEWNNFLSNLQSVYQWKRNVAYPYPLSYASAGNVFSASLYNQAVQALQYMGVPSLSIQQSGNVVTAYSLNQLVAGLNSI